MACSLALAILSSACRLPDIASSEEMAERVPALVKVVKAGGVPNIITRPPLLPSKRQSHEQAPQGKDVQAVSTTATVTDALECLVSVASCGSKAAADVVLQQGGLEAATKALAAAAGTGAGRLGAVGSKKLPEGVAPGQQVPPPGLAVVEEPLAQQELRHTAMLAVKLVELLLERCTMGRLAVVSEHTDVLQHTVTALGTLIGHPSVLAQQRHARSSSPSAAAGAAAAAAAAASTPGPATSSSQQEDAAMLQLEALHALLLILPMPQEMELHKRLASAVHRQEWPASVRRGLNWLLRSRISAVQKHSALQLAAALVELAGPLWLLARGEQLPEAFLQVLAETLHVEIALLLHDALYPDQMVREDTGRSDTRQHWQMPAVSEPFLQALRDQALAKDAAAAEQVTKALAAAQVTGEAAMQLESQAADQPGTSAGAAADGASGTSSAEPAGAAAAAAAAPMHAAGERAARLLPGCYLLLEAVIEVLAGDSAMEEDEMMVIDEAGESEEEEEFEDLRRRGSRGQHARPGGLGMAPQRQGQQLLQPGVSQKAAQQLMYSLETTVSVLLQFMDELQEQGGGGGVGGGAAGGAGAGSTWAGVQADLALGAVRVLGRYLAEAPDAHTEDFRQALPFMLRVGTAHTAAVTGVQEASAIQFLLPGLLQATSSSSTPATQLKRAICKSKAALGVLASFLEAAADEAAQLAAAIPPAGTAISTGSFALAGTLSAGGSGAVSRQGSFSRTSGAPPPLGRALRMAELGRVERLMADVAALLLNVVDAKDLGGILATAASLTRWGKGSVSGGNIAGSLAGSDSSFMASSAPIPRSGSMAAAPASESAGGRASVDVAAGPQLGLVVRQLLPAVAGLARWWKARSVLCTSDADLYSPQRQVEQMGASRLMPRTLICCGTLASVVLEAAVKQLAAAAAGQPQDLAHGLGVVLPRDVQPLCDLMLQALQVGCCVSLAMMEDEEEMSEDAARERDASAIAASVAAAAGGSGGGSVGGSGSSTPRSGSSSPRSMRDPMLLAPLPGLFTPPGKGSSSAGASSKGRRLSGGGGPDMSMIVDDFPGDAEHAWERLGNSTVALVELLVPFQTSAKGAGWMQQLLAAAAAAGGAAALQDAPKRVAEESGSSSVAGASAAVMRQQELLRQSVGLRLLLTSMQANAAGR